MPCQDPWAFLSTVGVLSRAQVDTTVRMAESRGQVIGVRIAPVDDDDELPWETPPARSRRIGNPPGPVPERIELVLGNDIYLSKKALSPWLRNEMVRLAAFQNPEFYRAQAMRLPTYGKPRIIACAEDHDTHLSLPRGCLDELEAMLQGLGVAIERRDERNPGAPIDVEFQGSLRPDQQQAADAS